MTWGWQPHKYVEVSGTHKCAYGAIATTRAVRINVHTAFKVLKGPKPVVCTMSSLGTPLMTSKDDNSVNCIMKLER